jgi:hypothetical protein
MLPDMAVFTRHSRHVTTQFDSPDYFRWPFTCKHSDPTPTMSLHVIQYSTRNRKYKYTLLCSIRKQLQLRFKHKWPV